jgi:hypothetical protein
MKTTSQWGVGDSPSSAHTTRRDVKGSAGCEKRSDFFWRAAFDQETIAAFDDLALDQEVTLVTAKSWDVDARQGIRRFQPEPASGLHGAKTLLRAQHGQGAFQPLEIVNVGS